MSGGFKFRHIPALIAAMTMTFGGVWPLFDARGAMLEFGFPTHIAEAPGSGSLWVAGMARTSALGILMFIFYYRGQMEILDTFLAVMGGYLGLVDTYVVWKEGKPGMALFRFICSGLLSAWGFAGYTAGP